MSLCQFCLIINKKPSANLVVWDSFSLYLDGTGKMDTPVVFFWLLLCFHCNLVFAIKLTINMNVAGSAGSYIARLEDVGSTPTLTVSSLH